MRERKPDRRSQKITVQFPDGRRVTKDLDTGRVVRWAGINLTGSVEPRRFGTDKPKKRMNRYEAEIIKRVRRKLVLREFDSKVNTYDEKSAMTNVRRALESGEDIL